MTKLQLIRINKRQKEELEEQKAVNDNLRKSLDVMKSDPGYAMQSELLELRKRTNADAFLIDEYRKSEDSNRQFMELQKNHIDSLSFLIGVLMKKATDGSAELINIDGEEFIKLDKNELMESQGQYSVVFKEDENNNLYIKTIVQSDN